MSSCQLHICGAGESKVFSRVDDGVRWCFACRGRRSFEYRVTGPLGMSYYGPEPSIRCTNCGQIDGDVGFGGCREWE